MTRTLNYSPESFVFLQFPQLHPSRSTSVLTSSIMCLLATSDKIRTVHPFYPLSTPKNGCGNWFHTDVAWNPWPQWHCFAFLTQGSFNDFYDAHVNQPSHSDTNTKEYNESSPHGMTLHQGQMWQNGYMQPSSTLQVNKPALYPMYFRESPVKQSPPCLSSD